MTATATAGGPPAVSVLVPTRDRAHYLGDAIRSVLDQTDRDFEVIVIDDGSTDGTSGLMATIGDPRVRYLVRSGGGIGAAMNAGLRVARGRYIARIASDDRWLPRLLETLVPVLAGDPRLAAVYAAAQAMDAAGRPLRHVQGTPGRYPGDALRSLLFDDSTCTVALLARRASIEAAGGYDEALPANEDWDLCLRMALHGPFRFVDAVLARIRWHDGNLTGLSSPAFGLVLETRSAPLDALFARSELPTAALEMKATAYANVDLFRGLRWLQAGRYGRAASAFSRAIVTSDRRAETVVRIAWLAGVTPLVNRSAAGRRALRALADARRQARSR